ncbi:MAG: PQQ-binding-like beta-propeller repeat protein [Planctomycetes bacterium]|nr:PQQ-binding-like beta-propeller repeat protein [Planctomycetota bacterium]
MEKLKDNPDDTALKEEIRALDLLARKAFFASRWQIRTGGILLIIGVAVMLLSLKSLASLRRKLPQPEGLADSSISWSADKHARKLIAAGGILLLFVSLIAAIMSHSELSDDSVFQKVAELPSDQELLKNWTNFRGPGANSIAHNTNVPTSWDGQSGEGIIWKAEVPKPGYSSPVVWEDRVFITGGDKTAREIYCYSAKDGQLLWQREVIGRPGSAETIKIDASTGFAAPTMATDGRYVFAIFATGDLVCLDLEGNRIWARNSGLPDNHYGHSSSLLTFKNLLFVQYDQRKNSKLLALDTTTGQAVWEAQRGPISWSSPICVDTGRRMELILTNSRSVDSYDPETGAKLWTENCLGGEVGPSAAYADGMVFVANEYAQAAGIRITAQSDSSASKIVWTWDEELPNTASPLATDKYVLFASSSGYIFCLDAKKGKTIWEAEFDDGFYSSPILVDNRVYALDLSGVMHIFELAEKYNSMSEPKLGEGSSCTPAFLDDRIYIRGDKHLYCIGS